MAASLEVSTPRPSRPRPKLWRVLAIALMLVLAVAWLVWYVLTPEQLPTSDDEAQATSLIGTPVYVGMFRAPEDFGRELHVRSVAVDAMAGDDIDLEITPLLCRGGAISTTTDPDPFCDELVDPAGDDLAPGDSIVIAVDADAATVVIVDRIEISFREGIVTGTKPAGIARAIVALTAR